MMSLWDALRMNMMISYQELVRTFPNKAAIMHNQHVKEAKAVVGVLAIVGAGIAAYNTR